MKRLNGFAQIPLMIALLLMAIAIPIATQLVQQNTENRSQATAPKLSQYDVKHAASDSVKTAIQAKQAAQNAADNPNDASAQRQAAAAADAAKTAQAAADKVRAEATMAAAPTSSGYYVTSVQALPTQAVVCAYEGSGVEGVVCRTVASPSGAPAGVRVFVTGVSTDNLPGDIVFKKDAKGNYLKDGSGNLIIDKTNSSYYSGNVDGQCANGHVWTAGFGCNTDTNAVSPTVAPNIGAVGTASAGGVSVTIGGAIDKVCSSPILPTVLIPVCGGYNAGAVASNAVNDYCKLPANSTGTFCTFVKGNVDLSATTNYVGGSIKTVCSSPILPLALALPCGAFNTGYNAMATVDATGKAIKDYCSLPANATGSFCNLVKGNVDFSAATNVVGGSIKTVCSSPILPLALALPCGAFNTGYYTTAAVDNAIKSFCSDPTNAATSFCNSAGVTSVQTGTGCHTKTDGTVSICNGAVCNNCSPNTSCHDVGSNKSACLPNNVPTSGWDALLCGCGSDGKSFGLGCSKTGQACVVPTSTLDQITCGCGSDSKFFGLGCTKAGKACVLPTSGGPGGRVCVGIDSTGACIIWGNAPTGQPGDYCLQVGPLGGCLRFGPAPIPTSKPGDCEAIKGTDSNAALSCAYNPGCRWYNNSCTGSTTSGCNSLKDGTTCGYTSGCKWSSNSCTPILLVTNAPTSPKTPTSPPGGGGNPPKATSTTTKKPGGGGSGGSGGTGGTCTTTGSANCACDAWDGSQWVMNNGCGAKKKGQACGTQWDGTWYPSPTGSPPSCAGSPTPGPSVCANECPATFSCYSNNGDYKWFATGMPMVGYSLESVNTNCLAVTPMPTFKGKAKGDANCDGTIDTYDYSLWHKEFYDGNAGTIVSKNWNADFTGPNGVCDGVVDTYDYSLWHKYFYELMGTN